MDSRSLPLVRRGIRIVWLGILFALSSCLVLASEGLRGPWPPLATSVLPWVFLAGISTSLVGIALTTSAPRESGVPRWAFGILAGSTLAWVWPVFVWGADLPAAALPEVVKTLSSVGIVLTLVAFSGLLAVVCRWFAANEPPKMPGERSGQWTRLARNTTWLFRVGCLWLAVVGTIEFGMELAMEWLGMAVLMLFPVVMLVQAAAMITAPLWVIWFIVTAVRFEVACRRSAPRGESPESDWRPESEARLNWFGLAAGALASVAFVAVLLGDTSLGEAWRKRHAAEIAANSEGEWEFEVESEPAPASWPRPTERATITERVHPAPTPPIYGIPGPEWQIPSKAGEVGDPDSRLGSGAAPAESAALGGDEGPKPEHATGTTAYPYYTTPGPRELLTRPDRDDAPRLSPPDASAP